MSHRKEMEDEPEEMNIENHNNNEEDDDDDDDENDPFAGLSNSSALQSLMFHLASSQQRSRNFNSTKMNSILERIKDFGSPGAQFQALSELCETLSMADTLSSFPVDKFIPALVDLVNAEFQPDLMLYATRALTYLMEVMPTSIPHIVEYDGALLALSSKLQNIQYIDVAEQAIYAMEKISKESFSNELVEAGTLSAILSFVDFFDMSQQRTIVQIVLNICKDISSDDLTAVVDVVPTITQMLNSFDTKIAENSALCITSLIYQYRKKEKCLDEICSKGVLQSLLEKLNPEDNTLSPQIRSKIADSIALLVRTSKIQFQALMNDQKLGEKIENILKDVLKCTDETQTDTSPSSAAYLFSLISLIKVLLPNFSLRGCPDKVLTDRKKSKKSKRRSGLEDNSSSESTKTITDFKMKVLQTPESDFLDSCFLSFLPLVFQVSESFVSPDLRFASLRCVLKIINLDIDFSPYMDKLKELPWSPLTSSFLCNRNMLSFVCHGLLLTQTLLEKMPIYIGEKFRREGVFHDINELKQEPWSFCDEKKDATTVTWIKTTAETIMNGIVEGSSDNEAFVQLQLAATMMDSDFPSAITKLRSLLKDSGGDISTFELLNSGVISSLVKSLTCTDNGDKDSANANLIIFCDLFLRNNDRQQKSEKDTGNSEMIKEFIHTLHQCLQTKDDFMVQVYSMATKSGNGTSSESSNSINQFEFLSRPIRICLQELKNDPNDKFSQTHMLYIDPLSSVKSLESFMKKRLGTKRVEARNPLLNLFSSLQGATGSSEVSNKDDDNDEENEKETSAKEPSERRRTESEGEVINLTNESFTASAADENNETEDLDDNDNIEIELELDNEGDHAKEVEEEEEDIIELGSTRREESGAESGAGSSSQMELDFSTLFSSDNSTASNIDALASLLASHLVDKQSSSSSSSSTTTTTTTTSTRSSSTRIPSSRSRIPPSEVDAVDMSGKHVAIYMAWNATAVSDNNNNNNNNNSDKSATSSSNHNNEIDSGERSKDKNKDQVEVTAAEDCTRKKFKADESIEQDKMDIDVVTKDDETPKSQFDKQRLLSDSSIIRWVLESKQTSMVARSGYKFYYAIEDDKEDDGDKLSGNAEQKKSKESKDEDVSTGFGKSSILDLELVKNECIKDSTSSILILLKILETLSRNKVNSNELKQSDFVNSKINAKLLRQLQDPITAATGAGAAWCDWCLKKFPFLFNYETRVLHLRVNGFSVTRGLHFLKTILLKPNEASSSARGQLKRYKIKIERSKILERSSKMMHFYVAKDTILEVDYHDEVGTGLGPTLEFFSICSFEFTRRNLNMWRSDESDDEYVKSVCGLFPKPMLQNSSEDLRTVCSKFETLGSLCGKAIVDQRLLDISFSPFLFTYLLNDNQDPEAFSLDDVADVDPALYKSLVLTSKLAEERAVSVEAGNLENVKKIDDEVENMCLDFSLPGYPEITFKESYLGVTGENLAAYVQNIISFTLHLSVERQLAAFRKGWCKVFPIEKMTCFIPAEIDILLKGSEDQIWTPENLSPLLKPDHGFTHNSPSFRNFLNILSEFDKDQRRKLLQFLTGSPRLPNGGLKALSPPLTVVRKSVEEDKTPDDYLPSVMTCVNYLKLPDYSTQEIMKQRLVTAMNEGGMSFHLS